MTSNPVKKRITFDKPTATKHLPQKLEQLIRKFKNLKEYGGEVRIEKIVEKRPTSTRVRYLKSLHDGPRSRDN